MRKVNGKRIIGITSLLLEEVRKRLPGVFRRAGGGFALDDSARREEFALVPLVLVHDFYSDRLTAFEASARIEVRTLTARVQIRLAIFARA